MMCDFCSQMAVFTIRDEYHYKDNEGYLRVRALPYVKSVCRQHEILVYKVIYYSEELQNGERR
jgi:hypothetical protein